MLVHVWLQHLSGARDRVNLAGRIVGYEQEVEKKKVGGDGHDRMAHHHHRPVSQP